MEEMEAIIRQCSIGRLVQTASLTQYLFWSGRYNIIMTSEFDFMYFMPTKCKRFICWFRSVCRSGHFHDEGSLSWTLSE